jgi:hypothetical protein
LAYGERVVDIKWYNFQAT